MNTSPEFRPRALSSSEQVLLVRMAVFEGGCSLDAVERVCGDQGVLGDLGSLVDHSLVLARADDERPRFSMLDTIHEFAREQLEGRGEMEVLRRAHAAYYVALAEEAEPGIDGRDQIAWLRRVDLELDNMRAVIRWALEVGQPEPGLRLVTALAWYWVHHGQLLEGQRWLNALLAVEADSLPERLRASALRMAGWISFYRGDLAASSKQLQRALALARESGDVREVGFALTGIGVGGAWQGDPDRERVRTALEQSYDLWRELDDPIGQHMALTNLGLVAWAKGDLDRVAATQREALEVAERIGAPYRIGATMGMLGLLSLTRGEFEVARTRLRASLELEHRVREPLLTAHAMIGLMWVACCQSRIELAARLQGAADCQFELVGAGVMGALRPTHELHVATIIRALGEERFHSAVETMRRLSPDEAVASALRA